MSKMLPKPRPKKGKPKELPDGSRKKKKCPACGKVSAADAAFCQYCGQAL